MPGSRNGGDPEAAVGIGRDLSDRDMDKITTTGTTESSTAPAPDDQSLGTETSPERGRHSHRQRRIHGLEITSPYLRHSRRGDHARRRHRHRIARADVPLNLRAGGSLPPVANSNVASLAALVYPVLRPSFEIFLSTYMVPPADPRLRLELVAQPRGVLPVGVWPWGLSCDWTLVI
jgi:hypothetical protein